MPLFKKKIVSSFIALAIGSVSTSAVLAYVQTPVARPADKASARRIYAGHYGDSYISPNGRFRLVYQQSGSLELLDGETVIWSSNTPINGSNGKYGYDPMYAVFQEDGNLVIYHRFLQYPGLDQAVWSSGTSKKRGATLAVQDDGNVVIYGSDGRSKWNTGTCCR